jgi:type II secretory pathway component PulJ
MLLNTEKMEPLITSAAPPVARGRRRRGFTLGELIISTSVAALLSVGLFSFFLTTYRIGFVNKERNLINASMRKMTANIMQDGRQSNYFVLYESTKTSDRDNPSDHRLDGQSGDFLVFVYTEGTSDKLKPTKIKRIVAYYRMVDSGGGDSLSPVQRYERELSTASDAKLEDLLPSEDTLRKEGAEVLELSLGLADGRLFYNFWGRSIMVNGQIYHGNEAKRVTETYNFTVSPRG